VEVMNLLRSSFVAQNAIIRSESTAKHCAFEAAKGEILSVVVRLRKEFFRSIPSDNDSSFE
jgi:hypothetical protein